MSAGSTFDHSARHEPEITGFPVLISRFSAPLPHIRTGHESRLRPLSGFSKIFLGINECVLELYFLFFDVVLGTFGPLLYESGGHLNIFFFFLDVVLGTFSSFFCHKFLFLVVTHYNAFNGK